MISEYLKPTAFITFNRNLKGVENLWKALISVIRQAHESALRLRSEASTEQMERRSESGIR